MTLRSRAPLMVALLVAVSTVSAQAPAVPTGLRSTVNGNVVSVGWDAAALAVNYRIQVGTSTGVSNVFDGAIGTLPTPREPFHRARTSGVSLR